MTLIFAGKTYDCTRAIKSNDKVTLFLTESGTVEFSGVSDWNAFTLEGGEWALPEVTAEEQLRADVDFLAAMTGVSL